MIKVAFICYGNACRSQFAESILKSIGGDLFAVYSAGIHPLGMIPSEIIQVLNLKNMDYTGQYSKGIPDLPLDEIDYAISMTGQDLSHIIPSSFHGTGVTWTIPDPYGGDFPEYERVFEIVHKKIEEFIESVKLA